MKNQKKQGLILKKLTIANLRPNVIAKFKGGDPCIPTELITTPATEYFAPTEELCPSGNPCNYATGNPCEYPD